MTPARLCSGILAVLCLSGSAVAADTDERTTAEQRQTMQTRVAPYLATKSPYPEPVLTEIIAAPEHCRLVHINHLGRHGARRLNSLSDLEEIVDKARDAGLLTGAAHGNLSVAEDAALTDSGKKLAETILALDSEYREEPQLFNMLTPLGIDEQYFLGTRIFSNTGLNKDETWSQIESRSVVARSTAINRARASRQVFLIGLTDSLSKPYQGLNVKKITTAEGEMDRTLRFYDHCGRYQLEKKETKKKSKDLIAVEFEREDVRLALDAFAEHFVTGLDISQQLQLGSMLYKLCQLDASMEYRIGVCAIMLDERQQCRTVFEAFSRATNIRQYYKRGPAPEFNGVSRNMAIELINDFISTTDDAVNDLSRPVAHLRFAHDSTVIAMLQLLDIVTRENSINRQGDITWNLAELAPMSANIVWQTFQCSDESKRSQPVFKTRMLINERPRLFPAAGCQSKDGLCNWFEIKEYYQQTTREMTLESVCGKLDQGSKAGDD